MYQREHFFRLVKNGLEVVFSLISENQNAETLQFDLSKCERIKIEYTSPSFVGVKILTTQKYGGNYYEIVGENKIKIVLSNLHNAPYLLNGVAFYGSYTLSICSLQIDVPSNVSQGTQDLGTITQVVVKSFEIGGGGGGGFTPTEEQVAAMNSGINAVKVAKYEDYDTNKQDKITDSTQTSDLADSDYFSDLNGTTNKRWTLLKVWEFIKSKFTYDTDYTDAPTDTDTLANLDKDTAKIKRITFANLWTWMKGKITSVYYPVGSVVLNMGTNPGTNFGGTWELYATGTKALYLDATAGTTINEELPNIKGSCNLELGGNSTRDGAMWSEQKAGNRSPNWAGSYSWATMYFDASKSNSVYKDNGKVRAEGITICAWKRTA